jgi:hypothetical protein
MTPASLQNITAPREVVRSADQFAIRATIAEKLSQCADSLSDIN